jgi:hypothetical protein
MKILHKILLILCFVFLALGVVQCFRWGTSGEVTLGYLLNFIPFTAFGGSYLFLKKRSRSKSSHIIAVVFCVFALLVWGVISLGVEIFLQATADVTNVKKYEDILTSYWGDSYLITHFPQTIPDNALDVSFSFRQAFLQGGAHIQLRLTLSEEKIDQLYRKFSKLKTKSFMGGNINDHINMKEGMPTTSFYTNNADQRDFPEDYEIMIFDEVLEEKDRLQGAYWNHGKSHGVAISKIKHEIVYWAESW